MSTQRNLFQEFAEKHGLSPVERADLMLKYIESGSFPHNAPDSIKKFLAKEDHRRQEAIYHPYPDEDEEGNRASRLQTIAAQAALELLVPGWMDYEHDVGLLGDGMAEKLWEIVDGDIEEVVDELLKYRTALIYRLRRKAAQMASEEPMRPGLRVMTAAELGSTTRFIIRQHHLDARKPYVTGVVTGYVPGHGGDVWWVRHEKDDLVAAYMDTELTVIGVAEGWGEEADMS